jgi:hypothetical protein
MYRKQQAALNNKSKSTTQQPNLAGKKVQKPLKSFTVGLDENQFLPSYSTSTKFFSDLSLRIQKLENSILNAQSEDGKRQMVIVNKAKSALEGTFDLRIQDLDQPHFCPTELFKMVTKEPSFTNVQLADFILVPLPTGTPFADTTKGGRLDLQQTIQTIGTRTKHTPAAVQKILRRVLAKYGKQKVTQGKLAPGAGHLKRLNNVRKGLIALGYKNIPAIEL